MAISTDLLLAVLALVVTLLIGLAVGIAIGSRTRASDLQRGADERSRDPHGTNSPGHTTEDANAAITSQGERSGLRRAAIIINPSKTAAQQFKNTAGAVCREAGWAEPLFLETTEEDPGYSMAREALNAQVDVVIAAGGDGTVRTVAAALAGTEVPLGIVPLGTGNLLARNLSIVLDRPEWALRTALWGEDSRIDVAHAQTSPDGQDHVFLVMAGLGFDAAVMADTDDKLKTRVGWLAYVEAGSRKLIGSRTRVELRFDDEEPESTRVRSVLGGNCGKVQGGLELLPGAKVDDGFLDVLVVSPKNLAQWVGVGVSIITRRKRSIVTEITRCRSVIIRAEHEMAVQLDGDPYGSTAYLAMEVEPAALTVRTAGDELRRRIRTADWPVPFGYSSGSTASQLDG